MSEIHRPEVESSPNLEHITPRLQAFYWQQFLKRLALGMSEDEASRILLDDLNKAQYDTKPTENLVLLTSLVDEDCDELKNYLTSDFDLETSHNFTSGILAVDQQNILYEMRETPQDKKISELTEEYFELYKFIDDRITGLKKSLKRDRCNEEFVNINAKLTNTISEHLTKEEKIKLFEETIFQFKELDKKIDQEELHHKK